MKLTLNDGTKLTILPHCGYDKDSAGNIQMEPDGKWAIPGGKVVTDYDIVKWAEENGARIG